MGHSHGKLPEKSIGLSSKKLVNDPAKCVNDSVKGFVMSHSHVKQLGGHNVVIRSDLEKLKSQGKVLLVSGGGSGHEPFPLGYVGPGMLTANISGGVFSAPPTSTIMEAISVCASRGGVLLLVLNYTGDRLNFGKAAELAKSEGIKIDMVIIGEDCAVTSKDKSAGRRGLCGAMLCHKMAGAMAEMGKSLGEISSFINEAAKDMGTISVSLSSCSIPGKTSTFHISDDKIEFGLGIHGEAGVEQIKMTSASSVVQQMIDHVRNSQYLREMKDGRDIALVVNNLGGTSNLELSIVAKEALEYLDQVNVKVKRCYVGTFITSLEMAGISLTMLLLNNERLTYLDFPTSVPGWTCGSGQVNGVGNILMPAAVRRLASVVDMDYGQPTGNGIIVYNCARSVCTCLIDNEEQLNELDRAAGDGDTGTTLSRGAKGVFLCLTDSLHPGLPVNKPHDFFITVADKIEETMGGSSGALISLLLSAMAVPLMTSATAECYAKALRHGINAVKKYGGAEEGDRTMLDALCPALLAIDEGIKQKRPLADLLESAAHAAREGADSTSKMQARAGRASYLSDKRLTQPDPGAVAIALAFAAMSQAVSSSDG